MKNTLPVTAVFAGLLAFSQAVLAHDGAPTEAIRTHELTAATQPGLTGHRPALDDANIRLAQVTSPTDAASSPAAVAADEGAMPSVAYGLVGLLLMICVLVKRRNEPPVL